MKKLNKYLQPTDSLQADNRTFTRSVDFDIRNDNSIIDSLKIKNLAVTSAKIQDAAITTAKIEDLAVTSAKIDSFNFNQGQGGTLTLGGTANGNGVLNVNNSLGSAVVIADNAGILVKNGQIIVQNDVGGTVVDSGGIVSTVNFPNDQVTSATGGTTAGTAFIDVPGATLSTFVLSRGAVALITATSSGYNVGRLYDTSAGVRVKVNDSIDGDLIQYPHLGNWLVTAIDFVAENYDLDVSADVVTVSAYIPLSAGTHTLKMMYRALVSGTARVTSFVLNYSILGA